MQKVSSQIHLGEQRALSHHQCGNEFYFSLFSAGGIAISTFAGKLIPARGLQNPDLMSAGPFGFVLYSHHVKIKKKRKCEMRDPDPDRLFSPGERC